MKRNQNLFEKNADALQKFDSVFPVVWPEAVATTSDATLAAPPHKMWRAIESEDLMTTKRVKLDDINLTMKRLAEGNIHKVGTIDPVGDFNAMVTRRDMDLVVDGIFSLPR